MAGKLKKKPSLRGKEMGNGSNIRDKVGSKFADENTAVASKVVSMGNVEISDESTSMKCLNDKTVDELFDYILDNLKEVGMILGDSDLNDSVNQVKSTSPSNVETTKQVKNPCTLNHRRKRT